MNYFQDENNEDMDIAKYAQSVGQIEQKASLTKSYF